MEIGLMGKMAFHTLLGNNEKTIINTNLKLIKD